MAWRCGSLSRSLLSAARTIPSRSSISRLHRPSSPSLRSNLLHPRRSLFTVPRTLGVLGCTQSLLPLHTADAAARLTSHISVESRACCELSQELFRLIERHRHWLTGRQR
ncbi:hypothetical protein CR513_57473 [Mucuna pruriens]|uniref:Protein NUCLEAR FUSION DEFECTIVE 6, chloroplastic/mitochondrial n=1 Tax=Mucuna pruriens TaxID=157652 RepID=A0A371EDA3_MUCPR|nr:hypothetical protein CR513_57473 [Mucuna pruriens]